MRKYKIVKVDEVSEEVTVVAKEAFGSKIKRFWTKFKKPALIVGGIAAGTVAAMYAIGGGNNTEEYDYDPEATEPELDESDAE